MVEHMPIFNRLIEGEKVGLGELLEEDPTKGAVVLRMVIENVIFLAEEDGLMVGVNPLLLKDEKLNRG